MSNNLVLATTSLNQTPLDWPGNSARIIASLKKAKKQGASILCLPELAVTGYGIEDQVFSSGSRERALASILEILPHTKDIVCPLGVPFVFEDKIYNCVFVLADKKIVGIVPKQNLATYGLHYESRWYSAWPQGQDTEVSIGSERVPIGDLIFDFSGARLGFEICHDSWVDERPLNSLAERGVDIVLNPSASHFAFGKYKFVRELVRKSSNEHSIVYAYANLLGNESGRVIYDGMGLIAQNGAVYSEQDRFSFSDHTFGIASLSFSERNSKPTSASGLVEVEFDLTSEVFPASNLSAELTNTEDSKEIEFAKSVSLGLFDYLRKSKSKGYVVSLSGGADSSAVAVLVRYMIDFSTDELGLSVMQNRLLGKEIAQTKQELMSSILTTVYQSTASSGKKTEESARKLSEELSSYYLQLDVSQLVDDYCDLISDSLKKSLTWEENDLALQNIQARVRGPSVWMIANLKGAILLATSNRSEAAVGYTTMDGDTCGGLSPIAGIDKAYIREWLEWAEKLGPFPVSALSYVNSLEPTAELRPGGEQRDEADLMPYSILDKIERLAIRDKLVPKQIFKELENEGYEKNEILNWIEKFFKLWSQNQWKRERYAPSFHLDDENLDPKTWCRFPILSGGFEKEIEDLKQSVKV